MKLHHIIGAAALAAATVVSGLGVNEAYQSAHRPPARPYAVTTAPSNVDTLGVMGGRWRAAWEAYQDLQDGCRADFEKSYRGIHWGTPTGDNIDGTTDGWYVRLAPYQDGTCD